MHARLATLLAALLLVVGCAARQTGRRDPQLVTLEGALGNRFLPAGQRSDVVARLRVATRAIDPARRPRVNVALVVDTSGSMDGRAMDDARAASLAMVDALGEGDRLAVVTFDAQARVLVTSTELDAESRAAARARVRAMEARGTTDLAGGLRLGLLEVANHYRAEGINRVVLLSDGVPNDRAPLDAMARSAAQNGITITTLGLGTDYDETVMAHLAQHSGGRFHYVQDSAQVAAMFRDEVLRMQRVVGRNAIAVLTAGPDVEVQSVVGMPATRNGSEVRVPLGDITEGATRDLVVRLSVPGRRNDASVEVLDAVLTFTDAMDSAGHCERHTFLGARSSSDAAQRETGRDPEVERVAAEAQLAAGTIEAIRDAREGNMERAQQRLDEALAEARRHASVQSQRLERQQRNVSGLRAALASVRPTPARAAGAPSAAPEPVEAQAAAVREAHDEAVQVLQGD
ncbi:MAG: VWA domain-containing protein [Polyangiales bacterium]